MRIARETYRSIWDLMLQPNGNDFSEREIARVFRVSRSTVARIRRDLNAYCSPKATERDYGKSIITNTKD